MPKLYYFDIYGVAEPIRMLLALKKVEYEDVRLSFEEQAKLKAEGFFPSGQVPVWVGEEGNKFNQSNAIFRFLGAKHGLYPESLEDRFWADWAIETKADLWKGDFYMPFFGKECDEATIKDRVEKTTKFLGQVEHRLKEVGDHHYIAGEHMTIGDITLFAMLKSIAYNEGINVAALGEAMRHAVEEHHAVKAWFDRMSETFAEYLAHRPLRPM